MTQTDQQELESRLAELERTARFGAYGRFYAPIAVVALALSFLPLFDDVVDGDIRTTYGTIWQMAGRNSGDPAVFGILLMLALIALLAVATVRVRSPRLPIAIAVDGALIVLMLISKPGTGSPTPSLSDSGTAALMIALGTVALALAHAAHLYAHRRGE